jgi:hypothetical protein
MTSELILDFLISQGGPQSVKDERALNLIPLDTNHFIFTRIPTRFNFIYVMHTVLCYLTQFLLNAAQHVSSLYKAHFQGLFC